MDFKVFEGLNRSLKAFKGRLSNIDNFANLLPK